MEEYMEQFSNEKRQVKIPEKAVEDRNIAKKEYVSSVNK